ITQPLLERAQLRIVERSGDLLAIARDERNSRATVEQLDRGVDLLLLDSELIGYARLYGSHHGHLDSVQDILLLQRGADKTDARLILQAGTGVTRLPSQRPRQIGNGRIRLRRPVTDARRYRRSADRRAGFRAPARTRSCRRRTPA